MKKVISFSLWGDNPRYTEGAIRNVELAKEVYTDWVCRIHIGANTPLEIVDKLNSATNTEIIFRDEPCDWTGMFWRFEDAADSNIDIMVCRDIDSRLTRREKNAVDQWLKSDSDFHIMRDHQYHSTEILGGMWGVKGNILSGMKEYIKEYNKGNFWQVDQNFLREVIYPIVVDHSFIHDEFFGNYFNKITHPFPDKRDKKHFVGQAYAGNDKILDDDEYFCDYLKKQETYYE